MRRLYGFMVLAFVVIFGILCVESGQQTPHNRGGDDSVYSVVLGGHSVGENAVPAESHPNRRQDLPIQPPPTHPAPTTPEQIPPPPGTIPLTPDPPESYRYTVRSGDTLGKIVLAHLGSASPDRIDRVRKHNKLADADAIRPGDILVIPVINPEKHTTSGTETLRDIAKRMLGRTSRVEALLKANPALPTNSHDPLPRGIVIWIPR